MESADPGIFDRCHSEYSSLAQVWLLLKEKSIGDDGADQRSYKRGHQTFSNLSGADRPEKLAKGCYWVSFTLGYHSLKFRFSDIFILGF